MPTHNRPDALSLTIAALRDQEPGCRAWEIVVVDDGSDPPVEIPSARGPAVRVVRFTHGERSAARNRGAHAAAATETLVFIDDDILLEKGALAAHLAAQRQWPGALVVGSVRLPDALTQTPFGAFRQCLEREGLPQERGPVAQQNLCTAQNMSISRNQFLKLGGFDQFIVSAEDQDLALRHSAAGGTIVFLPEAAAVHNDSNRDLRSYCSRSEWGAEHLAPFCLRHPGWPENRQRVAVNGPIRWGTDSHLRVLAKIAKDSLGHRAPLAALYAAADLLAARWPSNRLLPALYRVALGIHLQRGFRRGWLHAVQSH